MFNNRYNNKNECYNHKKNIKPHEDHHHLRYLLKPCTSWKEVNEQIISKRNKHVPLQKNNISQDTNGNQFLTKSLSLASQLLNNVKYANGDQAFINSMKYMFYKIGKGIYVLIKNGEIVMYNYFVNTNFKNDYAKYINMSDKQIRDYIDRKLAFYKQVVDKKTYKMYKRSYLHKFKKNINTWMFDNCDIANFTRPNGAKYNTPLINMFYQTIKELNIGDCEFFINTFDHPVLHKDGMEPFEHIVGNLNTPLISHKYDVYLPILSRCTRDGFLDILIPTPDDWLIVDKGYYNNSCSNGYLENETNINRKWSNKKNTAVFRGSTTNCGDDETNSVRIALHKLSEKISDNDKYNQNNNIDKQMYLDAGITALQFDDLKLKGRDNITFVSNIKLAGRLTFGQQSMYKYIINADGAVTAFRLPYELNFNSTIEIILI